MNRIGHGQPLLGKPMSQARIDLLTQVAAFDLMCAARSLKPPAYNFALVQVSAAALALRADRKAGLL